MNIENDIFQTYTPDFKKLIKYGFKKDKNKYLYKKVFKDGEFAAKITISESGKISGIVFDVENNDEFLPLRVKNQQGAFVAKIREEYSNILTDIRDNCFSKNYFVSNQSNRITDAIITKYGSKSEFLWKESPEHGVFRNYDSGKWYGIIMNIPRLKLGGDDSSYVEVINLKLDKDKIQGLHKKDGYYPAWHMNKKSWITITLDDTVPDKEILAHIDESYSYTVKQKKS